MHRWKLRNPDGDLLHQHNLLEVGAVLQLILAMTGVVSLKMIRDHLRKDVSTVEMMVT